ncbi:MAG: TetR family transcriptional regulator [Lachnospiraceae bacterium]|nr:TetR family transcriptional regulator [Lachnospiraceae bacterium]
MAIDMKKNIVEAAKRLLFEKNVKKLTVTNIVEECQITRQAFYYHFEDVPDMVRWSLEQDTEQFLQEIQAQGDAEKGLRYFFLTAVNAISHVKKGIQTNYRDEIEKLLEQYIYHFFEAAAENRKMHQIYSRSELQFILRYHSQAVMGLLRGWTSDDTENLNEIVHMVYLLMTGERFHIEKP